MKKTLSLLAALSLVLTLTACGGTKQPDAADTTATPDVPAAPSESQTNGPDETLTVALGTPLTGEAEYTADDGAVLLTVKYELPLLEPRAADGGSAGLDDSKLADICRAFNDEMRSAAELLESSARETLDAAKEAYASLDAAGQGEWTSFAEELTVTGTYQTDGLLSVVADGYAARGGVHPSTYLRTWNFDLTTGEFITFDTLTGDSNPFGQKLRTALTSAIWGQITEEMIAGYFDDYYERIDDLAANASFYFGESGMTVVFDIYVLAPYAAGRQAFDIAYGDFRYLLDEHTRTLFDRTQYESVVDDYLTAQTMWAWFHMSMPPLADGESGFTADNGVSYYPAALGGVTTLDGLRELLCRYVSGALADEWLSGGKFAERDGALYAALSERGSDITIGDIEYTVEMNGDSGILTQTVHRQDFGDNGQTFLTGETDEYVYPFDIMDGHAVFTGFPCPL